MYAYIRAHARGWGSEGAHPPWPTSCSDIRNLHEDFQVDQRKLQLLAFVACPPHHQSPILSFCWYNGNKATKMVVPAGLQSKNPNSRVPSLLHQALFLPGILTLLSLAVVALTIHLPFL